MVIIIIGFVFGYKCVLSQYFRILVPDFRNFDFGVRSSFSLFDSFSIFDLRLHVFRLRTVDLYFLLSASKFPVYFFLLHDI